MLTFIAWIALIGVLWTFAFYKVSPKIWIPSIAVLLLIYSYFHFFSVISLIVCWLLWAIVAGTIICSPCRRRLITTPFLKWFHKQQPPLTPSEQQVLDAGGLWWEQQFFTGHPNWQQLSELEKPRLTQAEQSFIDNQVETLCGMLNDWEIVHKHKDLPDKAWDYIKKEKFWGLVIEKQYGGHQFSAMAHSTIVNKIATRSYSAALTVMVPNSLGPAELLHRYGTQEQKTYYLPRLAKGDEIPCFALTAPEAGSDATSIKDSGVVCKGTYQNKEVLGIRLNWNKRYITLAPVATLIGLAFKLYDPDHLLGDKENVGITLALVPANQSGVEIGSRHYPLNLAFMNGPTRGKDVFIPIDWIIGGVESRGQGWQMMMECLAVGRGISLPALSSATAQLCFRMTGAYAFIRQQFHRSIGEFDGVKEALARIGGFTYLCEATRWFTAQGVDSGVRPAIASAVTKYHLTEICRKVVTDAMDIHGGRAIQMGPRNYLGNIHDGMPTSITVEGANILTRNLIIFGQGVMRCHPYLRHEIAASSDPKDASKRKQFDQLILKHTGFVLSQFARALVYGLTGGRWIRVPKKDRMTKYYRQLTRMSNAFVWVTDITLAVMGRELKLKETISARLGDVFSHLYMASAVLKYYQDQGQQDEDNAFVDWCIHYCLYQIHQAFIRFFSNFSVGWVSRLMRWIIFPFANGYAYPSDKVGFQIAHLMQKNSSLRDRLTSYCYIGHDEQDVTGRIEHALQSLLVAAPVFEKIEGLIRAKKVPCRGSMIATAEEAFQAGLLTADEWDQLKRAERLRQEAIQVDEFVE